MAHRGIGAGRQAVLGAHVLQPLADLVAAQHERARRRAKFRGERPGQRRLAGAHQAADRQDHGARRAQGGHGGVQIVQPAIAAAGLHMGSDHGAHRQERRQQPNQRRIAIPPDITAQHPVGGGAGHTALQIHQQEGKVIAEVDGRQVLIELQRVERRRAAVPNQQVAQMQVAMRPPHEAGRRPAVDQRRARVQHGQHAVQPQAHRIRRQPGRQRRTAVAQRHPAQAFGRVFNYDGRKRRVHLGDGVRGRVQQRRRQGQAIQEVALRHAGHAQHPVDRRASVRNAEPEAAGSAHDGHDVAIQPRRIRRVQLQLTLQETPPVLDPREIQERQLNCLFQLPYRVGAAEHRRDVRLDRRDAGKALQERRDLRLPGRNQRRARYGYSAPTLHPSPAGV